MECWLLFVDVGVAVAGLDAGLERTSALLRYLPRTSSSLPIDDFEDARLDETISLLEGEDAASRRAAWRSLVSETAS